MRKLLISTLIFATLAIGLTQFAASAQATSLAAAPAGIVAADFQSDACDGLQQVSGGNPCDPNSSASASHSLTNVIQSVVNLLSVIVGVAAIIMVVISGFKYVTSGGDSNNVATAKRTLIYAIVGLVIVALAQFIVHFVLTNV